MSPLFMDTSYDENNSPGSLSVEDSCSTSGRSEKKGEGQSGQRGTKRQEKNRDAARKSRKKQTERADELHEELQSLEHANSTLHKEIASLKKELQLYTTALERHKPFCRLRDSVPSSCLSVTPTAECQTGSHPLGAPSPPPPAQAPSSTHAAPPPVSPSYTSGLGPQSLDCVRSIHLSTSALALTTASSTSLSAGPSTSSSSVTVPYSGSFSAVPAPHSLFSDDPPSLITSREANAMPVCTGLVSNLEPATLSKAAQTPSRQGAIHDGCSTSAEAPFSTFQTMSFNVAPHYSHLAAQKTGLVDQGCSVNVPLLHPIHHGGNPNSSNSLLTFQDPSLQPLSVPPQANLEPSLATVFASKPSHSGHAIPSPTSLLSLLTIPSPFNVPQTTSSSFDGLLAQPPPSVAPSGDLSKDPCLSELLEFNDWILQ